jgi:hypothetical protein
MFYKKEKREIAKKWGTFIFLNLSPLIFLLSWFFKIAMIRPKYLIFCENYEPFRFRVPFVSLGHRLSNGNSRIETDRDRPRSKTGNGGRNCEECGVLQFRNERLDADGSWH